MFYSAMVSRHVVLSVYVSINNTIKQTYWRLSLIVKLNKNECKWATGYCFDGPRLGDNLPWRMMEIVNTLSTSMLRLVNISRQVTSPCLKLFYNCEENSVNTSFHLQKRGIVSQAIDTTSVPLGMQRTLFIVLASKAGLCICKIHGKLAHQVKKSIAK